MAPLIYLWMSFSTYLYQPASTRLHLRQCVCLTLWICQPACLPACMPVSLSVRLSVSLYVSVCQPACLRVCLSVCLSVCVTLFVCLPACLPACMPVSLSVCLCHSICLSTSLPACVYARQFVCVTVSPCFRLAGWLLSPCLSVCQRVRVFASQPSVCVTRPLCVCRLMSLNVNIINTS